jgi:hypothetical protein
MRARIIKVHQGAKYVPASAKRVGNVVIEHVAARKTAKWQAREFFSNWN